MSIDATGWAGADHADGDPQPAEAVAPAAGPVDAGLPAPPVTGDGAVDQAISRVARAVADPVDDQVTVIDAAHRTLQDRLADVEG